MLIRTIVDPSEGLMVNNQIIIDVDPDAPAGLDMETIKYIDDDYIGDMLPKESESPLPQCVLESLG